MSQQLDSPPFVEVVTDTKRILSGPWTRWLQFFWERVNASVSAVGNPIAVTNQSASIATTTLYTVVQGGSYQLNWYLRVMVADGVSSSAQVTITWREGSHTSTKTFAALTGDTTSTYDGQVFPFHADSGTTVTFAVAYASNTAAKMRYRADAWVEWAH